MRYLLLLVLFPALVHAQTSPDQIYGELFIKTQMDWIFKDQKTFADAVPVGPVADILGAYHPMDSADLRAFVLEHFSLPVVPGGGFVTHSEDIRTHILRLWKVLRRPPMIPVAGSSLLALPYPYIVPGGRFGEVFYWDSYFTMLGLKASGEDSLMWDIAGNFAYMLDRYGFIPNGNRTYFMSRSQPPFFSLIVGLLGSRSAYARFQPELLKEYAYWMDSTYPTHHVVVMPDGSLLNRYYDRGNRPRPEAFYQDSTLDAPEGVSRQRLYTDLRSAAESGWDFSSRWFRDGTTLSTIHVTDYIPVDLNGLLYELEKAIALSYTLTGNKLLATAFEHKASLRKAAINKWCWDPSTGYYGDYDLSKQALSPEWTLAGMTPFFFNLAPADRARCAASFLAANFLKAGGFVTSLRTSGQQWDAPNGWAPLEWMTISGLSGYHMDSLARVAATRWVGLNRRVYRQTGKMMEKYNVEAVHLTAGGGEYPSQDGFGWTNGVYLALTKKYGL